MIQLLAAVLLSASGPAPDAPDVVARVDGLPITSREAGMRLARSAARPRGSVVDELVTDHLLAAEARRRRIDREPEVAEKLAAERRRLAGVHFLEARTRELKPTEADVVRAFHATHDTVRFNWAAFVSREDAEASFKRLEAGGAFAEEAKLSVDSRGRNSGGDRGRMPRLQVEPQLAEVVFGAQIGKPVGPVPLGTGFAVLVVTEREIADEKDLPKERERIERFLASSAEQQMRAHVTKNVAAKNPVEIDRAFLESTGKRLTASPEERAHVVAKSGPVKVTYGDVLDHVREFARSGPGNHMTGPALKRDMAEDVLKRRLLEDEAVRLGHAEAPDLAPIRQEAEVSVLAAALRARIAAGVPEPQESELRQHLADRAAEYELPRRRTCSQIVLESRSDAKRAQNRLAKGESFEEVARSESLHTVTANRGGLIGDVTDPGLANLERRAPKLAAAFRNAKPNRVVGPVESPDGLHLLRCGPVANAAPAPFDEVRPQLAKQLRAEREKAAIDALVAELRGRARIEIVRR